MLDEVELLVRGGGPEVVALDGVAFLADLALLATPWAAWMLAEEASQTYQPAASSS